VDAHLVRERFPALAGAEVFFDGPGGSQTPAEVIDAMVAYLRGSSWSALVRPPPTSRAASRRRSPSART
jgi:selenocysteine lyase/cysteine desulfurase